MKINESALVIGKLIIAWLLIAPRSDSLLQDVFCFHYCAGQGEGKEGASLLREVGDSRRGRETSNRVFACISTTLDLKCFITASCADDPWVVLIGRFPCGCLISLHYVCVLGLCPPGFMEAESKWLRHCIATSIKGILNGYENSVIIFVTNPYDFLFFLWNTKTSIFFHAITMNEAFSFKKGWISTIKVSYK